MFTFLFPSFFFYCKLNYEHKSETFFASTLLCVRIEIYEIGIEGPPRLGLIASWKKKTSVYKPGPVINLPYTRDLKVTNVFNVCSIDVSGTYGIIPVN